MSIPIDFRFETWQEGEPQTMVQLKDGSVYIVYRALCESGYVSDIEPVSRSYMGMILKDEMRITLTKYISARKKYKEACRMSECDMNAFLMKDTFKKDADEFMERYRYYQKCWSKFKAHSIKAKRVVNKQEAEAKKKIALREKEIMKKKEEKLKCGCNARRRRN